MKKLAILTIKIYKLYFSPILLLLFGHGCRFTPTCSQYAQDAIERFGVLRGLVLTTQRVSRCHPFTKNEKIFDPVP